MDNITALQGIDTTGIRKINSRAVLEALRTGGKMGRREISRITGLSFATVCRVVDQLVEQSMVLETGFVNLGNAKRKTALLDINPDGGWVAALDIGGGHIRAAGVDFGGAVRQAIDIPLGDARGAEMIAPAITSALTSIIAKCGKLTGKPAAVGVSSSGIVDSQQGSVELSFNLELRDFPVAAVIRQVCDVPVAVSNDVAASTLAEAKLGYGRSNPDFAYVTVGVGVGAGLVFDGQVRHVPAGAEFGLMVVAPEGDPERFGGRGYLESLASGRGIAAVARRELEAGAKSRLLDIVQDGPEQITAKTVAEAAQMGDELSSAILARAAGYLGIGIVNLAHTLGLTVFVLGGGVSMAGDAFWTPLRESVMKYEYWPGRIRLEPSALGKDPALLGAGILALDQAFAAVG
ncbi:MAG: ROK family protein [Armatimonadota bacterium]|nr:ROK family protein [bacterium]